MNVEKIGIPAAMTEEASNGLQLMVLIAIVIINSMCVCCLAGMHIHECVMSMPKHAQAEPQTGLQVYPSVTHYVIALKPCSY